MKWFEWFVAGYVTHVWVMEGLRALGAWLDRRHNDGLSGHSEAGMTNND